MELDRAAWAALRSSTPLSLTEADLSDLRGTNDPTSLDEVRDIYL
ncbi:MAG: type I pantothenate kinase, partial [Nocardiopsis sp. BM-2018]